MNVRIARENDLEQINVLRKQVNDLHVAGKPDVFKPGFGDDLKNHIYTIWNDPEQDLIVCEENGEIAGFATLHHIVKPESPYMKARDFLDVDEFGVDEKWRRKGVATKMVEYIKDYAREKGFHRIELNMWEFNETALAFYEAAGFATFRRYMEMFV